MIEVEIKISNFMYAGCHTRGTTAGKTGFRVPVTGFYSVGLKKGNRQEGNLVYRSDVRRINA